VSLNGSKAIARNLTTFYTTQVLIISTHSNFQAPIPKKPTLQHRPTHNGETNLQSGNCVDMTHQEIWFDQPDELNIGFCL